MKKLFSPARSTQGFTLVEALVAIAVFVIVMGVSTSIFTDAFALDHKTKASRLLYEESRVALDRIVKEVRRGTIDYEEYWSWHRATSSNSSVVPATDNDYGKNYGYYALQFFRDASFPTSAPTSPTTKTRQDENVGTNVSGSTFLNGAPALGDATKSSYGSDQCGTGKVPLVPKNNGYEQCELYLITADGAEKTILKLVPEVVGTETQYRLAMIRLAGQDSDLDGQIDTWILEENYKDTLGKAVFQKIQPDSIKITGLKFIIAPLEDPRKAFANFDNAVQVHPHVTIVLTARPSKAKFNTAKNIWELPGAKGKSPEITLQTTVSARAQNEVISLK